MFPGIVGQARDEDEPDPDRFSHRIQALGEAQGRMQLAAGHLAISVRIATLDVEQYKIDALKVGVISAVAEEAGGVERRVQAELLGCGEQTAGEADLYQRLATRDGEAAPKERRAGAKSPSRRIACANSILVPSLMCQVSGL